MSLLLSYRSKEHVTGAVQVALTSTSRITVSSCSAVANAELSALPAPAFSLSVPKASALVLAACRGNTVRMRGYRAAALWAAHVWSLEGAPGKQQGSHQRKQLESEHNADQQAVSHLSCKTGCRCCSGCNLDGLASAWHLWWRRQAVDKAEHLQEGGSVRSSLACKRQPDANCSLANTSASPGPLAGETAPVCAAAVSLVMAACPLNLQVCRAPSMRWHELVIPI